MFIFAYCQTGKSKSDVQFNLKVPTIISGDLDSYRIMLEIIHAYVSASLQNW